MTVSETMSLLDTKLAEHQERGASSVLLSVCTHLGRLSHMSVHLALIAGLALWKRKGRLKKGDSRSRFKKLSVQWQWVLLTLPGSSLASQSQRWPSVLKGCSTGQTGRKHRGQGEWARSDVPRGKESAGHRLDGGDEHRPWGSQSQT